MRDNSLFVTDTGSEAAGANGDPVNKMLND